eukprot:TRINITY_DN17151_c0_g1_i1.p1 TRINITY_DN17151_c0_g1~~TRINITY_DN17151_c0_g1_i1.p1  ORF type:complete len:214 (-),score=-25.93 TRINITY_DN17151_c0_g1_i1:778-1419(-)
MQSSVFEYMHKLFFLYVHTHIHHVICILFCYSALIKEFCYFSTFSQFNLFFVLPQLHLQMCSIQEVCFLLFIAFYYCYNNSTIICIVAIVCSFVLYSIIFYIPLLIFFFLLQQYYFVQQCTNMILEIQQFNINIFLRVNIYFAGLMEIIIIILLYLYFHKACQNYDLTPIQQFSSETLQACIYITRLDFFNQNQIGNQVYELFKILFNSNLAF